MNNFCKRLPVVAVFFSVILCIPIYAEYSSSQPHLIFSALNNQAHNKDFTHDKSHSDFSHNDIRSDFSGHRLSSRGNDFKTYMAQDFKNHFAKDGYTETEILNQRCLYMHDEFVKSAQTYSGYKSTIQRLYAELKNLNLIQIYQ